LQLVKIWMLETCREHNLPPKLIDIRVYASYGE